jgi:beta-lactamase superfamily II metal-dependent hydrolase
MAYEIEFFAVGEGSRAGDAIIVRYGEINNYKLMLIDGGTAETGEKLVAHLRHHFGSSVSLEHVVLTHSDIDHASGLREVLREIPTANVWLHIPWLLSSEAINLFAKKTWTKDTLSAAIRKEYDIIVEIVDLAVAAPETKMFYPFQGSKIGPFTVLSPSRQTYLHLLPQFDKTPEPDQALLEAASIWIGKAASNPLTKLFEKAAAKVSNWWPESWTLERLRDGGQTGASNESSVVLYADFGNGRVLLTGDAGVNALTWAANYAKAQQLTLRQFTFVQIPHHGSRRNVGPTILNELLGPIVSEGSTPKFSAYVSAPKEDDQHPRKIVLNAFMRRGGEVIPTQGNNKVHRNGFPLRDGYSIVNGVAFSTTVEAYD